MKVGKLKIPDDILIELARIFNTSTDYLLGINSNLQFNATELTDDEKEIVMKLLQYFNFNTYFWASLELSDKLW